MVAEQQMKERRHIHGFGSMPGIARSGGDLRVEGQHPGPGPGSRPSQTVAIEISASAAPPAAKPLATRQRRPSSSIAAGKAIRVGLKRHSDRARPARNRRSFSKHHRNSAQMKKTTAAI